MMKSLNNLIYLAFIAATIYSFNALAYDDDKKKERCRQPKIQEFTLPEYSETNKKEAQPEEEFTFVVSGWADSKRFKLAVKGKDIPFTVQSTETFHKIKAKLPSEVSGQTIRVNARIPALLGCYSTVGWLVKVADKQNAGDVQKSAETIAPKEVVKVEPPKDSNVTPQPKPDTAPKPSENNAPIVEAPAPSSELGKAGVVAP
jgi:hypothetical protein